jgi:hypothetical protein
VQLAAGFASTLAATGVSRRLLLGLRPLVVVSGTQVFFGTRNARACGKMGALQSAQTCGDIARAHRCARCCVAVV